MFSHVVVGADDLEVSRTFYDAVLGSLGIPPGRPDEKGRIFYKFQAGLFGITKPLNGQPASSGNGSTIGFSAGSPELVEAWHAAGIAYGGTTCDDPPGVRQRPHGDLYLAYLRDPYGNKLCGLHWL